MISSRSRELKRGRPFKMSKKLQRQYKEKKCQECSVVMTRMDFARILGKFNKVKIRYESSSSSKAKHAGAKSSTNPNTRLKNNENGMVLLHRNAYHQHPVKELLHPKKVKSNESPVTRPGSNILRENNRLKKPIHIGGSSKLIKKSVNLKQYGIIFMNPSNNNNHETRSKVSLTELLPSINNSLLPSDEWCIDYLPKNSESDQVYDQIEAELEDLMFNTDKCATKPKEKADTVENNIDEFPSIMDILYDSNVENIPKSVDQGNSGSSKSNLDSSDVEAMLLGKTTDVNNTHPEATQMDVNSCDDNKLVKHDDQVTNIQKCESLLEITNKPEDDVGTDPIENPQSPSILDETLQKGIEEHLPSIANETQSDICPENNDRIKTVDDKKMNSENTLHINGHTKETETDDTLPKSDTITHVIFNKIIDGKCKKSVTCPKNLKYSIQMDGKSVELLGAPKYISGLEDLQVLLQIVNESELGMLYVLY